MNNTRIFIRIAKNEKTILQNVATSFGYNLSEYIKYKLFNENADIASKEDRYIIPSIDKHNILSISLLYKILYLNREILVKQGLSYDEVSKLEQKALEYAREQREIQGYKLIANNDK